jgi:hypothetical protein
MRPTLRLVTPTHPNVNPNADANPDTNGQPTRSFTVADPHMGQESLFLALQGDEWGREPGLAWGEESNAGERRE